MAVHSALLAQPSLLKSTLLCSHCGNPVPRNMISNFCCVGCETVYHWINENHFQKYYDLKEKGRVIRKALPISESRETFQYLNDPEFLSLYSWRTPEGRWMDFYVEGVHCAACIWLTEKIPEIVSHVGFIRLNLGTSIATVRIDEDGTFSSVALELQRMGYRPHAVKRGESKELQKKENQSLLIRLGVAGTCAGNIMLIAVSLYGGAAGELAHWFQWISFGLFLPVILYSAVPFYQSAWVALKSREISIDIPVVFGILLGSIASVTNLLIGDDRIYFDSLSALIFLLLSTRYLLKRTQQTAFDSSHLSRFLTPSQVKKWNPNFRNFESARIDQIQVGDRVQILPGECIPIDGVILKGESSLDCALLSGESQPQPVRPDSLVFAGTLNLDSPIEVEVTQSGTKTRVGRILDSMEALRAKKARVTQFADQVSRYFIAAVTILSVASFVWGIQVGWHEGLNRALAIAIVTCPCTFALITPLALSMTLGRLAQVGILVKNAEVLEKLANIRSVFLDKTGTLTFGTPRVVHWDVPSDLWSSILAMESYSIHPVAKSIVHYLRSEGVQVVSDVGALPKQIKETLGLGISAEVSGNLIEIRRAGRATHGTELTVLENGLAVGRIILSDQLRPDSEKAVGLLKALGLKVSLLSGDHSLPVVNTARAVGIEPVDCYFEASPEKKTEVIQRHPQSLMVGDGANDAMALAQAYVGIAVHSGVEISLRAADVYVGMPGVHPIYDLIQIARETLWVIRRNLIFSIIYNLIAGGYALAGKIDPLFAAILMPMSALTVFLSSIAGTSKMKKAFERIGA